MAENGIRRWKLVMETVAATAFVLGLVFVVATRAGWVMTREAHAQDIRILRDELRRELAVTREYARQAKQFAACQYFSITPRDCSTFDPPVIP